VAYQVSSVVLHVGDGMVRWKKNGYRAVGKWTRTMAFGWKVEVQTRPGQSPTPPEYSMFV
jgi:hypothetical protein